MGNAIEAVSEGQPVRIAVAGEQRDPARRTASAHVLIASPASALELHTRSALKADEFIAVLFAWPESWNDDEAITALLQDIPRDAQRVVLSTRRDADGADSLVERYARKALSGPTRRADGPMAPPALTCAPSAPHGQSRRYGRGSARCAGSCTVCDVDRRRPRSPDHPPRRGCAP